MYPYSDLPVERLVAAAARLMAEVGFQGVPMADIAAAAAVDDAGAVSYHFGSREGLLLELASRCIDAMEERRREEMEALDENSTPAELVDAVVGPYGDLMLDPVQRAYLRINGQVSAHLPVGSGLSTGPVVGTTLERQWVMLTDALERGGRFADRDAALDRVASLAQMAAALYGSRAGEVTSWGVDLAGEDDVDEAARLRGRPSHAEFSADALRMLAAVAEA